MNGNSSLAFRLGYNIGSFLKGILDKKDDGYWIDNGPSIKFLGEDFYSNGEFGYVHSTGLIIAEHSTRGRIFYMTIDNQLIQLTQDSFLAKLSPFNFFVENPESWTSPMPNGGYTVHTYWGTHWAAYDENKNVLVKESMVWPPIKYKDSMM